MRKKIIAGNWKMNKTLAEGLALAKDLKSKLTDRKNTATVNVVVCAPFIHLSALSLELNGSTIDVGAQNCYSKAIGAYTGEISSDMLASVGVKYVILGHSERREYFNESNQMLAEKVNLSLKSNLIPLFCCGETFKQREENIHFDFIKRQLTEGLFHLDASTFQNIVIAYEPIWAIGTGLTASSDQAQEMHKMIRDHIAIQYGAEISQQISILYGGSCKPSNAKELFACPDVDGGLIGGASLLADDFIGIISAY